MIIDSPLIKARDMLESVTPLGCSDCGRLCRQACCSKTVGDSMELFPGEEKLFEGDDNYQIIRKGNSVLIKCNGSCDRMNRPLACRLFPLFPFVEDVDGVKTLSVIRDPRGASICPIAHDEQVKFDREFVRAVRRAGMFLMKDKDCADYLEEMSDTLNDILVLDYLL